MNLENITVIQITCFFNLVIKLWNHRQCDTTFHEFLLGIYSISNDIKLLLFYLIIW